MIVNDDSATTKIMKEAINLIVDRCEEQELTTSDQVWLILDMAVSIIAHMMLSVEENKPETLAAILVQFIENSTSAVSYNTENFNADKTLHDLIRYFKLVREKNVGSE